MNTWYGTTRWAEERRYDRIILRLIKTAIAIVIFDTVATLVWYVVR